MCQMTIFLQFIHAYTSSAYFIQYNHSIKHELAVGWSHDVHWMSWCDVTALNSLLQTFSTPMQSGDSTAAKENTGQWVYMSVGS